MFPTLLSKVSILLTMSMACGALGVFFGRAIHSTAAFITLALTFILGCVGVYFAAHISTSAGITALVLWTFVSGLFMAPCMEAMSELLGWLAVFLAFAGSAAAMSVCGVIGMNSGIDFSGWSKYLTFALFGLIIIGVLGLFVQLSRQVNIGFALMGIVIFSGFFILDFFRLSKAENTWESATQLTVSIYLDFINVLIRVLELIALLKKK